MSERRVMELENRLKREVMLNREKAKLIVQLEKKIQAIELASMPEPSRGWYLEYTRR